GGIHIAAATATGALAMGASGCLAAPPAPLSPPLVAAGRHRSPLAALPPSVPLAQADGRSLGGTLRPWARRPGSLARRRSPVQHVSAALSGGASAAAASAPL